MILSGKALMEGSKFLPVYYTQEFNTEQDRLWDTERRYFRPLLDEVFASVEHRNKQGKGSPNVGQIFMFTPLGDEVRLLRKVGNLSSQLPFPTL